MIIGNGPNTVSDSTVSNTELRSFLGHHRVPARDLSEFLSANDVCADADSPSLVQNSVSPLFRNQAFVLFSEGTQW